MLPSLVDPVVVVIETEFWASFWPPFWATLAGAAIASLVAWRIASRDRRHQRAIELDNALSRVIETLSETFMDGFERLKEETRFTGEVRERLLKMDPDDEPATTSTVEEVLKMMKERAKSAPAPGEPEEDLRAQLGAASLLARGADRVALEAIRVIASRAGKLDTFGRAKLLREIDDCIISWRNERISSKAVPAHLEAIFEELEKEFPAETARTADGRNDS